MDSQFQHDLKEKGHPAEIKALILIKQHLDPLAFRSIGYDKDKDITAPGIGLLFEIKNNQFAKWNVCVETSWAGKPSGITTTKADYYVYFAKDKYFVIKTSVLKNLLESIPIKIFTQEGNKNGMKILPLTQLELNSEYIWSSS